MRLKLVCFVKIFYIPLTAISKIIPIGKMIARQSYIQILPRIIRKQLLKHMDRELLRRRNWWGISCGHWYRSCIWEAAFGLSVGGFGYTTGGQSSSQSGLVPSNSFTSAGSLSLKAESAPPFFEQPAAVNVSAANKNKVSFFNHLRSQAPSQGSMLSYLSAPAAESPCNFNCLNSF